MNKFLLIFRSISTKGRMKKGILPDCIHLARFSTGLDGSTGLLVLPPAELWVCSRLCARVPGHGGACAAAAVVQTHFGSAKAARVLGMCLEHQAAREAHTWQGKQGSERNRGPQVMLVLNEAFHLMC